MFFLPFIISLFGCSDMGLNYEIKNEEIIYENIQIDGGFVYDQAIDILFVVDESGSMDDEQAILQQSMQGFYEELISEKFINLQWRVGIKSTDNTDGGVYDYVDWTSQNPLFELSTLTMLLSENDKEAGFSSALWSMSNDVDFHRKNADLLIIYISDEEEQTDIEIGEYNSLISLFKEEPFIVTESAIVATYESETRCSQADMGKRYIEVSEVVVDLCDTQNWIKTLEYAAEHIPTLNTTWYLTEVPLDSENIQVEINGIPTSNWLYSSDKNAIILNDPPATGSYVAVAYYF